MESSDLDNRLRDIESQVKAATSSQIRSFITELEELCKEHLQHDQLRRTLGGCYMLVKDAKGAERHFRAALEINPTNSGPYAGLLFLAHVQGDAQQAEWVYRMIKLHQPEVEPLLGVAKQLYLDKHELLARALLEALFEIDKSPQVYHDLALCCIVTNQRKKAATLIEEGMKEYPDNSHLHQLYTSAFALLDSDYIFFQGPAGEIKVISDES